MPRGSSSSENIHSDYGETHKTSSTTINSVSSVRSNQTAEYCNNIGSDNRVYSNISFDPNKRLILSKFFNSTRANNSTYENLCSGCGYGVFEARGKLCNFCQYVINGYLEDNSNIYENICDKCSELYSGGECLVCSSKNNKVNKGDNVGLSNNKSTTSKKLKKRLFHSLLGSLKRVKSFNVPAAPANDSVKVSTNRKLQIVHNVDGYDNVFRTNETFDLGRICELKRLKSSTSDHHIYGKLRKSDDHLQTPYKCVKQKSQSDDYLIGGTGCETLFRTTSINSHDSVDNDLSSFHLRQIQNSVGEWMTSLRSETHDYYSFGAPDTVICNPKSIPELPYKFGLGAGASSSILFSPKEVVYPYLDDQVTATDATVRLRSFSDDNRQLDFVQQMVNEFKRSLMEKQESTARHLRTKRQGIYLKLDEIESKQAKSNYQVDLVGDHRNCLSPSSAQPQSVPIELTIGAENRQRGVAHQLSKRCCIYEKDSEFVSDILQAFDSFLLRESATAEKEDEVNSSCEQIETVQENSLGIVSCLEATKRSDLDSKLFQIDFEEIIRQLALSKSLNTIVISYDIPFKVFLSAQLSPPKYPRLLKKFRRFQVFFYRDRSNVKISTSAVSSSDRVKSLTSETIATIDYIPYKEETLSNLEPDLIANSCIMTVPNEGTLISDDTKEKEDEEEPIYQPIWKFKTVGEVQENYITDEYYDHLPRTCDSSSASIAGVDIEDHDEWEPDDEFTFTTKLLDVGGKEADTLSTNTIQSSSGSTITGYASSISTMTIASTSSVITTHHIFRNICIFYSLEEPKIRAVLYEYDRNRCWSYFAQQPTVVKQTGRGANCSPTSADCSSKRSNESTNNNSDGSTKLKKSSESGGGMFADSVQAWKYMLLDVNYLEDEEDMIVSESKILKAQTIREMDISPPPVRTLQRFKSISTGNLLTVPAEEDKKSIIERLRNKCVQIVSESQILKAQAIKEMDSSSPPFGILQRFKSVSSGNLLDVPAEEDKKSITERVRNKLQRGVFKLQTRSPKENKKGRNIFRRNEATSLSLYLEDGMKPKYPIFKAPLEDLEMNETSYPDVPRFVVDCIEYIEQKDCIQMDGLYRASGNKVAVDELKQKLTDSYIYDPKLLVTDDIHTLTSLLKLFFRELGSPLIPQDSYQRLASTRNLMESSAIENMKTVFQQMKNPNRATLKFLIKHLTTVAHYSTENRMPASNLAIVWGPCILSANQIEYDIARMNTLAKVLIENYDKIFGDNERLVS